MARQGKIYLNGVCYSGSDVEGNTTETPTEDLTTIRIEDDVYSIPSGSGGSLTELYSYNSTTDPTQSSFSLNSGTNIYDYTSLIFLFYKDDGNGYVTDSLIIPTSIFSILPSNYTIRMNSYRDGSYRYFESSDGINWTMILENDNRWRVYKVYGL